VWAYYSPASAHVLWEGQNTWHHETGSVPYPQWFATAERNEAGSPGFRSETHAAAPASIEALGDAVLRRQSADNYALSRGLSRKRVRARA